MILESPQAFALCMHDKINQWHINGTGPDTDMTMTFANTNSSH